jgi:hypothetical protein
MVVNVVKKFPAFFKTKLQFPYYQKTATGTQTEPDESASYPCILFLCNFFNYLHFTYRYFKRSFSFFFISKNLYAFPCPPLFAKCSTLLLVLEFVILIVSEEKTNYETSDCAVFLQLPLTYSTSGPNIPLSTALSNTLILQTETFFHFLNGQGSFIAQKACICRDTP